MAASTARRTSSLTRGDSLTTRETVARETPATRATASRVAVPSAPLWPFDPSACATEPPSCESALTLYSAHYAPCQESALTKGDRPERGEPSRLSALARHSQRKRAAASVTIATAQPARMANAGPPPSSG